MHASLADPAAATSRTPAASPHLNCSLPLSPPCPITRHYMNPTHQQRVRSAWTLAADCELLLFLVDAARELQRPDPRVSRLLADSTSAARLDMPAGWQPPPAVLVLNKVDAIPPRNRLHLLPLADRLQELRKFDDVFFVSAKDGEYRWAAGLGQSGVDAVLSRRPEQSQGGTHSCGCVQPPAAHTAGRGLPDLRDFLLDRATPGEWTLDAGMATDRGEEEQVGGHCGLGISVGCA